MVCRSAAASAGWGVPSRVVGCVVGWDAGREGGTGVRGGVKDCVNMDATAPGRVGFGATSGMGRAIIFGSRAADCAGAGCVSSAVCGAAAGVSGGAATGSARMFWTGFCSDGASPAVDVLPLVEALAAGGSGRCSMLGMLQRGHTHSRELEWDQHGGIRRRE